MQRKELYCKHSQVTPLRWGSGGLFFNPQSLVGPNNKFMESWSFLRQALEGGLGSSQECSPELLETMQAFVLERVNEIVCAERVQFL